MGTTLSTNNPEKIRRQMIFIAIIIVIVILLGGGLLVSFGPKTVEMSDSKIPILRGGNNLESHVDKLKNNKIFVVIVVLLVVLLIVLLISSSKNRNRVLTEDDINQYSKQVKEARKIAGLTDNSQPPSEVSDSLSSSSFSLPGRPDLTGILTPKPGNYDDELNLEDFYKLPH